MKSIYLSIYLCILTAQLSNAQWVQMSNGIGDISVNSLAANTNTIFAGTSSNSGVYKSTNYGLAWIQTSLNNQDVRSLAVDGNNIYAGSYSGNGVYKSTDNGTTWTQTSLNNQNVRSIAVNGNAIYVGSGNSPGNGVYLSTDNGTSWTQTSLNNLPVLSLAANGSNVFAGPFETSPSGIYLSTNNGTNWTQTSLNNVDVYALSISGSNIFAGTYDHGVYVSTDNGTSWTQRNEGLTASNTLVYDICLLSNYIFAGTGFGGSMSVYRRPLSELTYVHPISNEVPSQFQLYQNYPNPFNPNTKIRFSIAAETNYGTQNVKLIVYDLLGKEILKLADNKLSAGTYEVEFDGGNLPSGIYYYRLSAEHHVEAKSMILIK